MSRTLCATVLLLALSACRAARADAFTPDDWRREAAFAAVTWADWQQTHDIARHAGMHETNPIIGRNPSAGRIDRYFAASMLAHWAITRALPRRYRAGFQNATIAMECAVVARNAHLGLRIRF